MKPLTVTPHRAARAASILFAVAGVSACAVSTTTEDIAATSQALTVALPQVPNQSNQILVAPRLVTILASNDASTGTDSATSLKGFSDALPASSMWTAVAGEYGLGALTSAAKVTGPALTGSQSKAALQAYVASVAAAQNLPPNGKTIYLLYIPTAASLSVADFGGVCGEHFQYPGAATDAIAVVPRCTPQQSQETQLGELTRNASHEVVEAATNPRQGGYNYNTSLVAGSSNVWAVWNGGDVELADLCEGTRVFQSVGSSSPSGGWEFQRVWSNKAAAQNGAVDPCVPAIADPYYSVSTPAGWYRVPPGETIRIPVTGWSSGTTGNWFLNRDVSLADASGALSSSNATITSSLGIGTPSGCGQRYAMNSGDSATLTVTVPTTAAPGDYAIYRVTSFDEASSSLCNPTMAQDFQHFWPVGVVVEDCVEGFAWNPTLQICQKIPVRKCTTPAQCCIQAGGYWSGKYCE